MQLAIICVPFQGDVSRWGSAMGPQAFLQAGLIARLEHEGHSVREPVWIDFPRAERTRDSVTNLGRIAARTSRAVQEALQQPESVAIVLEGNCTHAPGAVGGLARMGETPGIVWFDAHGDLCTMETTMTGLLGGMPYAVALGWEFPDWREAAGLQSPVRPEAAALLGTSDLDAAEVEALAAHPILHLDARALEPPGVTERVMQALQPRVREATTWYVHIDVDVAGQEVVPGGLTPAPSWPAQEQLFEAAEGVARAVPVRVISLAAYDPSGDPQRRGAQFGIDMLMAVINHLNSPGV